MGEKIRVHYEGDKPLRLDQFLVKLNIQELYSRTFIEKLIDSDAVLVNNIPVKKSYLLKAGDAVSLKLPDPEPVNIVPQDIPLDIVYEDEYLAIINKPAGMVVHPGFGNPDNTLVNAIVFRYGNQFSLFPEPVAGGFMPPQQDASGGFILPQDLVAGGFMPPQDDDDDPQPVIPAQAGISPHAANPVNRPGIVHRLDRGTSGLMIIAKNDVTQSALSAMFANRLVKKTYLTITSGIPDPSEGSIETYIARSNNNPRKMTVADNGKWALTNYKVLRFYHYFALVEVDLETGRMHQIRVHFAHRNYPVLGDLLYNTIKQVQAFIPDNMKRKVYELLTNHLHRQALHAWKISFTHPFTHQELAFQVTPPADFLYALDWLEQYFSVDNER